MSSIKNTASKITKSVVKANRSISKSIDKKLDGPFDKYNIFESIGLTDHCQRRWCKSSFHYLLGNYIFNYNYYYINFLAYKNTKKLV